MFATLIQTVTVGAGGATSITFSGIPSTYNDLVLVVSARATSTTKEITMNLNGSAANFANAYMTGSGANPQVSATGTTLIGNACISTDTANAFGNLFLYLTNYSVATSKTFTVESATETMAATAYLQLLGGTWSDTSVVSSLTLNLANFAQNSTASLYGVKTGSIGGIVIT
jgi:hypothetical protein